jgi:hypothetical protein
MEATNDVWDQLLRVRLWAALLGAWMSFGPCGTLVAESELRFTEKERTVVVSAATTDAVGHQGAVDSTLPPPALDPCMQLEIAANPTRPTWDFAAATTQCGVIESDSGWQMQPMGGSINQFMTVSSLRYGLTPKLDLRWASTGHVVQSGGGGSRLQGIGDQWVGARYRFLEQRRILPAMALAYTLKVPMANPAKSFGTGFVDHQWTFIASRDLGRYHLDFNMVGTLAGSAQGEQGATQFGLVVTRPVRGKLALILENFGGPQPGISDRFGGIFAGAAYALRPWLVFDGGYEKTYTAGSPRGVALVGITYAFRPVFSTVPRGSAVTRLLGR